MNTVKFHLFQSCRDQYRDYLTMCDDPDRNETALALQRAPRRRPLQCDRILWA